jgi:signal transduction histidine kinase
VARLTHLMEDLLDYGRTSSMAFAVGNLQEPISAAIRTCTPFARRQGVVLEERVMDGPVLVYMDRSRIEQVFSNLIENALHHAPEGSTVIVATEGFATLGRPSARVCVSDTGPGFRAEDVERAFEPFFTRRRGGTGLGLSIVERIVDAHEGHVRAANKTEGGAIVTVELPLAGS